MNKNYIRLIASGHLVTDIYQGALPAMLPFLISGEHISYASAAFLIFAANASSSVIQPLFGIYSDKISTPFALSLGVLLGGLGIGFSGLMSSYVGIFVLVALSGIGIALYHPEGAKLTNKFAGENKTSAVSIFAAGGNIGFAVGPIITTPVLIAFGLKGTILLAIPAVIMGIILIVNTSKFKKPIESEIEEMAIRETVKLKQVDEWGLFTRLTLTLLCRSVIFFGFNTFLALYFMKVLHQSEVSGSVALSTLIVVGAIGTLFAGKLADKVGNRKIILVGYTLLLPLMLIFLNIKNPTLAIIALIPLGLSLYAPYSPMVSLGQKYLPNHVGLASGITMGLGVTMGGIVSPVLGVVSDHFGIHAALYCLVIIPIFAVLLARKLSIPKSELVDDLVLANKIACK